MNTRMVMFHNDSLSCEPILRRMPNGDLLCVCQCGDITEPAPGNRVYFFLSHDNGETWTKPQLILPECGYAVYATEVMVLDGVVRAFLQLHTGRFLNMRCIVAESRDCGQTWTNAGEPPFFPSFCFIRSMVELKNGEILLPCQAFPVTEAENARLVVASQNLEPKYQKAIWNAQVDHMENSLIISDDRGRTWKKFEGPAIPVGPGTGRNWSWTEPTVVQLSDGRLAMLMRVNGSGYLWRSDSSDNGRTWTEAVMTDIPNPDNKPKLIALPDNRIALIHTPNPKTGMYNRNPLALWISDDDMETWNDKRVISDMPLWFCYPDGFYEDGHILFTIELNRHEILFVDHTL